MAGERGGKRRKMDFEELCGFYICIHFLIVIGVGAFRFWQWFRTDSTEPRVSPGEKNTNIVT